MRTFLIVDDSANNLYMLQKLFEGVGYEVITAVNGIDALEKARATKPDIIISVMFIPEYALKW